MKAMDAIVQAALDLGGVLSGENGIDLEKKRFLGGTMEPVVLDIMKKIKSTLNPNNIMNSGKIWD